MAFNMREVLDGVAAGSISPAQAEQLIGPPVAGDAIPPIDRISVHASAVKLTIVADPSIATAVSEGPSRSEQVGGQLVIRSDLTRSEVETDAPRSAIMKWIEAGTRAGSSLRIRVNPYLPIEVLTIAGSLEISGVRAPTAVGVEAGSAKLTAGSGPLQLSVASGSAEVEWQFHGDSTISAELGSAKVTVLAGSNVVVTAESSLGSANIRSANGIESTGVDETSNQATVGDGNGSLTVTSKLGGAEVRIP